MATASPRDVTAALLAIEQATGDALDARCAEMEARLRAAELEAAAARLSSSTSGEVLPSAPLTSLLPVRTLTISP